LITLIDNHVCFESNLGEDAIFIRTQYKTRIEALLFSSHQGMHITQIKPAFPTFTDNDIRVLIRELMDDYRAFDSALEIIEDDSDHFLFQVKHAVMCNPELKGFTKGVDYTPSELQLLAFIGYNQPISLQEIIDILGPKVKKSIKRIETEKMIEFCENKAVTFRIGEDSVTMDATGYITTQKFAEYFNVPNDLDTIKALFQEKMGEQ
jgi:chromosome segregation and condensation protein ScpB